MRAYAQPFLHSILFTLHTPRCAFCTLCTAVLVVHCASRTLHTKNWHFVLWPVHDLNALHSAHSQMSRKKNIPDSTIAGLYQHGFGFGALPEKLIWTGSWPFSRVLELAHLPMPLCLVPHYYCLHYELLVVRLSHNAFVERMKLCTRHCSASL